MMFKKWVRGFANFKHIVAVAFSLMLTTASMLLYAKNLTFSSSYLKFLNDSKWNYSVVVDKCLPEDTYGLLDRTLSFSESRELNDPLNAVVLMEMGNTHTQYDFLAACDIDTIASSEIAVSKNILELNNLQVGDYLYCRNKINNQIEEYRISFSLPTLYGVSKTDVSYEKGVMIIGNNQEYVNNLSFKNIYFYSEDSSMINDNGALIAGELTSKSSIKSAISKEHSIYSLVTIALMLFVGILFNVFLTLFSHPIYRYYKRIGYKNCVGEIWFNYGIYNVFVFILAAAFAAAISAFNLEIFLMLASITIMETLIVSFTEIRRLRGV